MSIADKLVYLDDTKSLLREAINAAGGNLTQETPFREYARGWLRDQSASLILDFSKQQYVAKDKVSMFPDRVGFEDIVTIARSSGGGRFNAQGQYEWVGPDEPRIDYDPLTGECLGLLVEEQRTNLLTYSSDFANAVWKTVKTTIVPDTAISPDGTVSADKLVEANVLTTQNMYRSASYAIGSYAYSIRAKNAGRNFIWLRALHSGGTFSGAFFNLTTGEITGISNCTATVYPLPGGWYDCKIVFSPTTNASGYVYTYVRNVASSSNYTGDGTSGIYLWGAQLEQGAFPTSYIPTEDAQVTRAADIATVNDLAPWFNSNQGRFSIKAKVHIGEPLLTAGDAFVIADSDELKEYQVSYSEDPQATQVDIGKGLIESVRYWPRETA